MHVLVYVGGRCEEEIEKAMTKQRAKFSRHLTLRQKRRSTSSASNYFNYGSALSSSGALLPASCWCGGAVVHSGLVVEDGDFCFSL